MKKVMIVVLLVVVSLIGMAGVEAAYSGPNLETKAIKKVPPVYPPLARRKRVQGSVTVKLQLDSESQVVSAEFVEGNALFKPAALDAAKQWVFQKSVAGQAGYLMFNFQLEEE
ncbi:MAG: TonB family protein [Acidobacteriota bacterium]